MADEYVVFRRGAEGAVDLLNRKICGSDIRGRVEQVTGRDNPPWTVVTAASEQAALEMAPGVLARDEMLVGRAQSAQVLQPI